MVILSPNMSQQDKDFLTKLDSPEGKKNLPEKAPTQCADVLINLINKLNMNNLIEYLLVLVDDILSEDKTRVDLFRNSSSLLAFLNQLTSDDLFAEHMSARIIAKLACWHQSQLNRGELMVYLAWIKRRLKAEMSAEGKSEYINSVVRCLQMMLRIDTYRYAFVQTKGVPLLLDLLSSKVNFQVQYQVVFCLWVLTFNPKMAENVTEYPHFIPLLAEILTVSGKEKVTRIVLAVFRNLIEKPKDAKIIKDHCTALVQNKVMKQLMIVDLKGSDDEDFMNDMELLINRLQASMNALSSFDQYAAEVKSGRLEWSTVHKSVQFWRENAPKIHENQDLLRAIVKLLGSQDPVVLAVACYDVGEYVRHYPRGKNDIEQLGGKYRVMALLGHEDPNVRYEALLAVQKLMVNNWEHLGRHLENDKSKDKKTKRISMTKEAAGSKTKP